MSTEAMKWMDIETAPKDGTEILIYDEGVKLGSWLAGASPLNTGDWWIEGGQITASNPTYWMPLPEAPNDQQHALRAASVLSARLGFMRATHYHCKRCGGELKYLGRIAWMADGGVKAIGCCDSCGLLFVEREMEKGFWPLNRLTEWHET